MEFTGFRPYTGARADALGFESGRRVNGARILWILLCNRYADDLAVASHHGPCSRDRKMGREERRRRDTEKCLAEAFSVTRSEKSPQTINGRADRKPFRPALR